MSAKTYNKNSKGLLVIVIIVLVVVAALLLGKNSLMIKDTSVPSDQPDAMNEDGTYGNTDLPDASPDMFNKQSETE